MDAPPSPPSLQATNSCQTTYNSSSSRSTRRKKRKIEIHILSNKHFPSGESQRRSPQLSPSPFLQLFTSTLPHQLSIITTHRSTIINQQSSINNQYPHVSHSNSLCPWHSHRHLLPRHFCGMDLARGCHMLHHGYCSDTLYTSSRQKAFNYALGDAFHHGMRLFIHAHLQNHKPYRLSQSYRSVRHRHHL